jgi:hypothetical protein
MNRRDFWAYGAALTMLGPAWPAMAQAPDVRAIDRARILRAADRCLREPPRTITAFPASRSPGGRNDYYSEADYWWPDPGRPSGPYLRRDGFSNPAKFTAHRDALIQLSLDVPALAAAWSLTGDDRYAAQAERRLEAWFVAPETRMAPHLNYAQAIIGVNQGRGIGVIDTLHLVEVARAVSVLRASRADKAPYGAVTDWFTAYLHWMTTSPNGIEERDQKNNHGTCWVLQAAEFARLTDKPAVTVFARERLKALIAGQLAPDGRQPLELDRTKPFGYCLFNLDVMATAAFLLSTTRDDLWRYRAAGSGSLAQALAFMAPFIADKSRWPYPPDVEHFADWPVRHPSLLFGGLALGQPEHLALWRRLDPDPTAAEVIRNYPIRQPVLWLA